jgi:16S rRNA G1207 methylase RsmC
VVYSLRVKSFALLTIAIFGLGCSSATTKVATSQNSYDFREARYEESCVVANPPVACTQAQVGLVAWEKHLHEAAKALSHGGKLPLQIQAIKSDEKNLVQVQVTK